MLASEKLNAILEIVDQAEERGENRNAPVELSGNDRERIRRIRRCKPTIEGAVLKGYKKGDFVFAYCPMCRKWHMHGHGEQLRESDVRKGSRLGTWIAHCRNDEAFQAYDVALYTKTEIREICGSLRLYPEKSAAESSTD